MFDLRILLQRGSVLTCPWWKSIRSATKRTLGKLDFTHISMTFMLMVTINVDGGQCYLMTATRSSVMREKMP